MKNLCIFDLDGTLLDTCEDIADSMNRILEVYHLPLHSVDWYKKSVGRGARNLILSAIPPDCSFKNEKIDEIYYEYRMDYQAHSMVKTKPYDGIPELLKRLTDMSIKMAVISNKPDHSTREMIKTYFNDVPFLAVYGDIEGKPIKPDPYFAYETLKQADVPSSESLFIGDTEVDLQFAKNASLFGIGVLWGFRDKDTLLNNGADAIVSKPEEILRFL